MNKEAKMVVGAVVLASLGGGAAGYALHTVGAPEVVIAHQEAQVSIECDTYELDTVVICVDGYTGEVKARLLLPEGVAPVRGAEVPTWQPAEDDPEADPAHPTHDVPCQEDEVYAVAPVPGPGLTWECRNIEELLDERGGY